MGNMEIWDKLRTPPPDALKTITGGRLSGFTDVSPMWRFKALTEYFGPCGIGWKYEIERLWSERGSEEQVLAFAEISLYIEIDGKWSAPIPGVGGSMLVTKERNGLHSSDEGFKMAVTDALSTAMKVLGVAADIYMGKWDGSKYKEDDKKEPEDPPINEAQLLEVTNLMNETGSDEKKFLKFLQVKQLDSMPQTKFDMAIKALLKKKEKSNA